MDCFQDIFLEAAQLHIEQITTTADKQVASTFRVLTSILIGYQTTDAKGYKQWVAKLADNATDTKTMLYSMMWENESSPTYYMLGW